MGSIDPANPQSINRYAYVLNNPMSLIDPLGLDCIYAMDDGSAVVVRGDCYSDNDNGYFVDGTIDLGLSITFNPDTHDLGYSLDNGGSGVIANVDFNIPTGQSFDPFSYFADYYGHLRAQPTDPISKLTDQQRAEIVFQLAYERSVHDLGCAGLGWAVAGSAGSASAPIIPKPFSGGGTSNTSLASELAGNYIGTSMRTPVGMPGTSTFAMRATANWGRAAGRYLPYVGVAVGAYEINSCLSSTPGR